MEGYTLSARVHTLRDMKTYTQTALRPEGEIKQMLAFRLSVDI